MEENILFKLMDGFATVSVVIFFGWLFVSGRVVTSREYLEMKSDRDFWRQAYFNTDKNLTKSLDTKDASLAAVESISASATEGAT
jgi:hypothetical protein